MEARPLIIPHETKILDLYAPHRLAATRAKAYVMMGLGDPNAMRPDEKFEFEPAAGRFKFLLAGEVRFSGMALRLATVTESDLAELWNWDPAALASSAALFRELHGMELRFPVISREPDLAIDSVSVDPEIRHKSDLGIDSVFVGPLDFANMLAIRLGYSGAYVQLPSDDREEMIAVKIEDAEKPDETPIWCTVCGSFGDPENPVKSFGDKIAICRHSAKELAEFVEICRELERAEGKEWKTSLLLCAFCGKVTSPAITLAYYSVCEQCASSLKSGI
jgi:hypothetical protein